MFLFKNSIISTFLDLSLFLRMETSSPALENSLSDGTDVPGTHKYFLASLESKLKRFSCVFHQVKGSSNLGKTSSPMYAWTSTVALLAELLVSCEFTTFWSKRSHKPGALCSSRPSVLSFCVPAVVASASIVSLASWMTHCSACCAASSSSFVGQSG